MVDSPVYLDETCATYDETQDSFDNREYIIHSKQISQYFNPTTYWKSGKLNYRVQNAREESLKGADTSIIYHLAVNEDINELYDDFFFPDKAKTAKTYTYENKYSV